jgi:hypothetical protein
MVDDLEETIEVGLAEHLRRIIQIWCDRFVAHLRVRRLLLTNLTGIDFADLQFHSALNGLTPAAEKLPVVRIVRENARTMLDSLVIIHPN